MTFEEAKEVFTKRGFVNGIFDGDKWRESVAVISKWLEQEPCEDCCNGNQIEKARLCQKSYLAGMEHKQEPCEDAVSRKADSICDSCTNVGCIFQTGIVRTQCAFYMPPHMQPDNCGNYVIQEPTTQPKTGHWIEHPNEWREQMAFEQGKYKRKSRKG